MDIWSAYYKGSFECEFIEYESVTVFFTFDSVLYSALGSVRKETQLLLHFFPQGRRHFKAHSTPKLK
jgi:hypothetical protein